MKMSKLYARCAGVLWRGTELIAGVRERSTCFANGCVASAPFEEHPSVLNASIGMVCLQGKRVIFVTNNSSKSRLQYLEKFRKLGLVATKVCRCCVQDFSSALVSVDDSQPETPASAE